MARKNDFGHWPNFALFSCSVHLRWSLAKFVTRIRVCFDFSARWLFTARSRNSEEPNVLRLGLCSNRTMTKIVAVRSIDIDRLVWTNELNFWQSSIVSPNKSCFSISQINIFASGNFFVSAGSWFIYKVMNEQNYHFEQNDVASNHPVQIVFSIKFCWLRVC